VVSAAVNQLVEAGHGELVSTVMLASEASLAWHARFGFREQPDYFVAQARCFSAKFELERREKLGILTEAERTQLNATAEQWWREVQRLYHLPAAQRFALPEL
jgi:hypothetical protein